MLFLSRMVQTTQAVRDAWPLRRPTLHTRNFLMLMMMTVAWRIGNSIGRIDKVKLL